MIQLIYFSQGCKLVGKSPHSEKPVHALLTQQLCSLALGRGNILTELSKKTVIRSDTPMKKYISYACKQSWVVETGKLDKNKPPKRGVSSILKM